MEKLKVHEVIVVEGKYDLNTIKQIVDGTIITTDGFGVFHNQEKLALIRRMAEIRGVIILTDSDGAGFLIRNYLKGSLPKDKVKHAYIPDVYGKEKRKKISSKEGKLGVEGMDREIIEQALRKAGATIYGVEDVQSRNENRISKADLYFLGLSGTPYSVECRRKLMKALELPEKLSPNALLDVLNALFSKEELLEKWNEISA